MRQPIPTDLQEGIVFKYLPDLFYGFLSLDGGETVFFYIDAFDSGGYQEFPPPIAGERVRVEVYPETDKKHRRAKKVIRIGEPTLHKGIIRKFNPKKGFGFIRWEEGECFFHRSDVVDFAPTIGTEVSFFVGKKRGKPRACHVNRV